MQKQKFILLGSGTLSVSSRDASNKGVKKTDKYIKKLTKRIKSFGIEDEEEIKKLTKNGLAKSKYFHSKNASELIEFKKKCEEISTRNFTNLTSQTTNNE
jgi:hypothetical protein